MAESGQLTARVILWGAAVAAMTGVDRGSWDMMPADVVIKVGLTGGCLHGCLAAAGDHANGRPGGRGLAVAALISWLLAEGLGAGMFRSWLASGGARDRTGQARHDSVPPALILGHAGLALAGFVSWVSFLVTGMPPLAWLAIGFLAPAIGLGISTVTVWTPFPARHPGLRPSRASPGLDGGRGSTPSILVTNEMLDQVLANEVLTGKLVDDLVERMLTGPAPPPPASRGWQLAPVIPILHGVLAITTFLLAMLAAIAAVTGT
jgi:hypothetical protein